MSKETENRQREPLARVIKRAEMPAGKIALLRLMAVFLSLIAGGLFIGFAASEGPPGGGL